MIRSPPATCAWSVGSHCEWRFLGAERSLRLNRLCPAFQDEELRRPCWHGDDVADVVIGQIYPVDRSCQLPSQADHTSVCRIASTSVGRHSLGDLLPLPRKPASQSAEVSAAALARLSYDYERRSCRVLARRSRGPCRRSMDPVFSIVTGHSALHRRQHHIRSTARPLIVCSSRTVSGASQVVQCGGTSGSIRAPAAWLLTSIDARR